MESKHNDRQVAEKYCWAITQAMERSWCDRSGSSVPEFGSNKHSPFYVFNTIWTFWDCVADNGKHTNCVVDKGKCTNCVADNGKCTNCVADNGKRTNCVVDNDKRTNCVVDNGKRTNYVVDNGKRTICFVDNGKRTNCVVDNIKHTNFPISAHVFQLIFILSFFRPNYHAERK